MAFGDGACVNPGIPAQKGGVSLVVDGGTAEPEKGRSLKGMAPDIAALKLKHAEHILEVVRGAEKQEAVRQGKLRHATSKANLAYLQRR